MKIEHFIKNKYETVDPYSGITRVKENLLRDNVVVIKDGKEFFGILTKNDIINKQHNLVIDCFCEKDKVSPDCDILDAFQLMKITKTDVLPVYDNNSFVGVLHKDDLLDYLTEANIELEIKVKERTKELEQAKRSIEDRLIDKTSEVIKGNESKNKLLSILAHDLRTPMNSILGFSELLEDELSGTKENSKVIEYLKYIRKGADQSFLLINSLLEWHRSINGSLKGKPEKIAIHECLSEKAEKYLAIATQKQIELNYHIDEKCFAYTDPNMLKTVLRNLISNAIKFTPRKGKISLTACSYGENIKLTVSDTGIGLSANQKEEIFHFNAIKTSIGTENESGLGLGLSICKELVEKQGGKIWVESEPGKGSDFIFTVPGYN